MEKGGREDFWINGTLKLIHERETDFDVALLSSGLEKSLSDKKLLFDHKLEELYFSPLPRADAASERLM